MMVSIELTCQSVNSTNIVAGDGDAAAGEGVVKTEGGDDE